VASFSTHLLYVKILLLSMLLLVLRQANPHRNAFVPKVWVVRAQILTTIKKIVCVARLAVQQQPINHMNTKPKNGNNLVP
jgi:hypothetical protein